MLGNPHWRRQFLLLFLPLCGGLIIFAILISQILIRSELNRVRSDDVIRVELGAAGLLSNLKNPQRHLMSLPNEAPIRAAINDPTPVNLVGMQQAFTSLLQRNLEYDQARWIDQSGHERVRVDKTNNDHSPRVVPNAELQDKSTRDYFTDTLNLPMGKIYTSRLDLNIENGKVQIPYKPTLRFVTPVTDDAGHRRGILVINYLAGPMLESFSRIGNHGAVQLMLLNRDGYWLSSSQGDDTWGFMFGHTITLAQRHPDAWAHLMRSRSGDYLSDNGLWVWDVVDTEASLAPQQVGTAPTWIVVAHQSPAVIYAIYRQIWDGAALICAPLLLVFAGLCWHAVWRSCLRNEALEARLIADAEVRASKRRVLELERMQQDSGMLTAIIESTEDAILSKDLDGIITSWNRGAEKLFGYTAQEAIGQHMVLLFPANKEEEERRILQRIRQGETIGHFDTVRRTKAGVLIDVSVTISPILDKTGRVIGASKIARDVTERNRAKAELDLYREHLEELVDQRTAQIAQANAQLREREAFIITVTDNLPGLVGYWDLDLRCRFANRAYREFFGRSAEEIVGMPINTLFGDEVQEQNHQLIQAVLAGEPQRFERQMRSASGEISQGFAHYIPDWRDGQVIGFFVLVTDVTSLKQAEGELRELNDKLELALDEARAANMAKTQFLANMSHEIRTPMNAVLGFIALVLEGEISDGVRRQLVTAHNAAKSLLLLINDILDLSKLQSKKLELEHVSFNLASLLQDCLEMLHIRAEEKGLALTLDYPKEAQRYFFGDPMRVRQIVTNIVGNAIKFTDTGYVHVTVTQPQTPDEIVITVVDTGIGMTAAQLERAFQPFAQGDASTSRRYGGTGLGLTICRQLAEIMDGKIWAESTFGQGSQFYTLLRLAPASGEVSTVGQPHRANPTAPAARHFRVLLADDIAENRELAQIRLVHQGHSVTLAENGQEVVDLFQQQPFDIILMDMHMPLMNGLDATLAIRRLEGATNPHIPIIALTASVMPQQRNQCLAVGMSGFVAKPVDFGELARLMEQLVPHKHGTPSSEAAVGFDTPEDVSPHESQPAPDAIDTITGIKRWIDPSRYRNALASFADHYGDAAVRLSRLHEANDWHAAHELAHGLKGVAGNLALPAVSAIATELTESLMLHQEAALTQQIDALDVELQRATAAITHYLQRDGIAPVLPEPIDVTTQLQRLNALRVALESDDPDAIEPVFEQMAPGMLDRDRIYLRELIHEFEFVRAREWVDHTTASITQASDIAYIKHR